MPRPVVLLVEDSADDAFFMQYALEKTGLNHTLQVVSDGQQALDYLLGANRYADRNIFPLPDLVFLDLKLPLLSGFDVLAWLRAKPLFTTLPVAILTGSDEERDRRRATELGANAYLVKPANPTVLRQVIGSLIGADPMALPPG